MSKEQIARVLTVATPERVPCGCACLHMTVPHIATDEDLEAARNAFPETHFERPGAYDICYCGDYRWQHRNYEGPCRLRDQFGDQCLKFDLGAA